MAVPALHKVDLADLRSLGADERALENFLVENPSALGLGDLLVRDRQRHQAKGRMDLLFEDSDGESRYEVELTLGIVDESHLVRTIEYWDVERRRYPAYNHCAVLVAEDVTSRFLNVITLFTGSIPFIAIQVGAFRSGDGVALVFNWLVDTRDTLRDEDTEMAGPPSSSAEWFAKVGGGVMGTIERCLEIINNIAQQKRALTFNKQFIGLNTAGDPNNFVYFNPAKTFVWVNILRTDLRDEESIVQKLEDAGFEVKNRPPYKHIKVKVTASPEGGAASDLLRTVLEDAVRLEDGLKP